jgi:iron complex transport system substrate-binding protein
VKLAKAPQKIISLDPANTEILFALGLGDRVVAVTDDCDFPEEAKEKPTIGSFGTPDVQKMASLSPDLVLASSVNEQTIPDIEKKGMTVLALAPKSLNEVMAAITLVGEVTQQQAAASQLTTGLQDRIKAVTDKYNVPESQRLRVFYIIWHDPLWTAGSGTLENELIQKAGGVNIAQKITGYGGISLDTIVAANPQVIIASLDFRLWLSMDLPLEYVNTEPNLAQTDARLSGRVYPMWSEVLDRPGPRLVDGLEELAMIMHMEASP